VTVQVSDALGETATATIKVVQVIVSPATATISFTHTQQLTASAGLGPYTWAVTSGGGTVSSSGLYTPPGTTGVATVRVTDSLGGTATATITVVHLAVSPKNVSIAVNQTQQFTISSGVGPYTWSMLSGGGTISSSGLYTAPSTSGTATVRVTDAIGQSEIANITIHP
jgi:hypothetical protein